MNRDEAAIKTCRKHDPVERLFPCSQQKNSSCWLIYCLKEEIQVFEKKFQDIRGVFSFFKADNNPGVSAPWQAMSA